MSQKNEHINLILFTSSFPYGKGESFLEVELEFLSKEFKKIDIYPFYYGNITSKRDVPKNVFVHTPVIPISKVKRFLLFFKSLFFLAPIHIFIKEFFGKKVHNNKNTLKHWFVSFVDFAILTKSYQYKEIQKKESSIFYFFWGLGWALSLTKLKKKNTNKYFLRLHGSDVYLERSNGYLPIRAELFENVDNFLPISKQIKDYLIKNYTLSKSKIFVSKLGTKYFGKNPVSQQNNSIKIVSCSNVIPLKRLHLIIDILEKITELQIEWTHFGDGYLMPEIIKQSKEKLSNNIKINFVGRKPNIDILEFYKNNHIDLFLNVSKYEGVPVSIMEAMSFGIPAIATNAGATSELVNNNNGMLINIDFDIKQVAKQIENAKTDEWIKKRENAFSFWQENYNAEKNYLLLSQKLKSLI